MTQPTTLENMVVIREVLIQVLDKLGVDNKTSNQVKLAYTEAATNIVQHANADFMSCKFMFNSSTWTLQLGDDGDNYNSVFHSTCIPPSTSDIKEPLYPPDLESHFSAMLENDSGRGISLIQCSCDQIEHTYQGDKNCLTLMWHRHAETRLNLLLVEDQISQQKIYAHYLSDYYNVICCDNGAEALKLLKRLRVHIVVTDVNMPVMDGVSLLEHINQNTQLEACPFIFLTSVDDPDVINKINYLGIDSYIEKPVCKDALLLKVEQVTLRHEQLKVKLNLKIDQQISTLLTPQIISNVHQYSLACEYVSAQGGGGDFLLSHQYSNGDVLYILGDVMGHNSEAKFFAHTYVGYLRGVMLSLEPSTCVSKRRDERYLADLMTQLSDFILSDSIASESLLTCQFLYVSEHQISVVSAGHPAPLRLNNETQSICELDSKGMILGLFLGQEYTVLNIELMEQERLICYTDGLFDCVDMPGNEHDLPSSYSLLTDMFIKTGRESNQAACHKIMAKFAQVAGLPAKDDALVLLINRK